MARDSVFTMRVDGSERDLLKAVATHLDRSESATLRWLIRVAAHELDRAVKQPLTHNEGLGGDQRTNAGD